MTYTYVHEYVEEISEDLMNEYSRQDYEDWEEESEIEWLASQYIYDY